MTKKTIKKVIKKKAIRRKPKFTERELELMAQTKNEIESSIKNHIVSLDIKKLSEKEKYHAICHMSKYNHVPVEYGCEIVDLRWSSFRKYRSLIGANEEFEEFENVQNIEKPDYLSEFKAKLKSGDHPYLEYVFKRSIFYDIETGSVPAMTFGTGKTHININSILTDENQQIKILCFGYMTVYDFIMSGGDWKKATVIRSDLVSAFNVDDTNCIRQAWDVLNKYDVAIAYNNVFDQKTTEGRFLLNKLNQPLKYTTICAYRNLRRSVRLMSMKMGHLSQQLGHDGKFETNYGLWKNIMLGSQESFDYMCDYNGKDITELGEVYFDTFHMYPNKCIDLSDIRLNVPQCRVDGTILRQKGLWHNHTTKNYHVLYVNSRNNVQYVSRHNIKRYKAAYSNMIRPL